MSSPTPHSQGSGRSYSHSGRSTPPQAPSLSLFGRSATQRSGPLRPELPPPPPPPPLLSPSSSFLSSSSSSASGSGRFAGMMSVSLTSVARTPTTTTPTTTNADSPQTLTPPTRKLTDSLRSLFSRKSTKRQASVSSASSVKSSFSLRAPGSTSEDFARFFPHLASAPMAEKASADDESDKGFYTITVYSYPESETLKISHSFDGQEIRSEIMQAFGLKMGDAYQIFDAKHYSTFTRGYLTMNCLTFADHRLI
ncbi:hypothetical protein BCR33DRAFT_351065 [Rhizoclosmatium globosum]|uniref:Uncharacterized protein n=1 Tax=Rhizoclosmatium globosum TaxID=329046 RepID=A0A1Y2C1V9_9FUNG|nr:hypothetical protein BCR33DRAFT_351065 [Rhizoclosmatium globosum]|eukprot:ORY40991.1 hypothetical protein BCR33DRAFT_351065 [Rhizoclosmatium globosum]